MTGYPAEAIERSAYGAGVRRFLHKPFLPDELLDELDRILN